ncbi:hypothetical protein [Candidatus Finniella inopinata]|uniref:Uncharacterized protein n=1 Tax=Candidatus Finniella inopinata TaxID=1696036 RepID=A0A4Q7DL51_9PROT|nr:hypothetical protein [Candidatus Finniella inopinata]RZI47138.1 hypothetical protein EQU50_00715 [Candidatus Finniella inopinata]
MTYSLIFICLLSSQVFAANDDSGYEESVVDRNAAEVQVHVGGFNLGIGINDGALAIDLGTEDGMPKTHDKATETEEELADSGLPATAIKDTLSRSISLGINESRSNSDLRYAEREDYRPKAHPVLSKSTLAKKYVECSTVCCFFGQKWFQTAAFLTSVGTCGLAGIAYGVNDIDVKNKLNLAILLMTVTSAAFKKFESYAHAAVHEREKEYRMFDIK